MDQALDPRVKYPTLAQAQAALNFQIMYPCIISVHPTSIVVISGRVLDLQWYNGLNYRMACGTADISGDYNVYPEVSEYEADGYHVTEKGHNHRVFLAIWHNDIYTFAMSTKQGVNKGSTRGLIRSLKPLDKITAPSPMVKYNHIFEAEYAVGFSIEVPSNIHDKALQAIYVIDNKVVDIVYGDGITYRMAAGVSDISGSFTDYPVNDSFSMGRFHVTARGDKEHYYVAVWNDGKFSYALDTAHGLSRQQIEEFIKSLRVTN